MGAENVGKTWTGFIYEVGLEKIREYANAVGETAPVHHDRDAAREAGYRDVVAPPMFVVVYSAGAMGPAIFDPDVGMNFARMQFFVFESVSRNQDGAEVARGTWTNIVRGG